MKNPAKKSGRPVFIKTMRFNALMVGVIGLIITLLFAVLISRSLSAGAREVMDNRLKADLVCLMDDLTTDGPGNFSLENGAIYLDGKLLGDGTVENASLDAFKHYEEKTGTFCYLFAKTDNDAELHYVDDGGYMQGHYIRIAGTTLGPKGERIEGTYIDKKVADAIEKSENGILVCEANVNGRPVYCCYQLIRNADGKVIGILSDGRSTAEMRQLIRYHLLRGILIAVAITAVITAFMLFSVHRISENIRSVRNRLKLIGEGNLTEKPLELHGESEFDEIADSVNEMTRSLLDREKIRDELSIMKHDLNLASAIQQHMLTRETFSDETRFDVYAFMTPARQVGGDFYDFFLIDSSHLAFLIADVSGKGVPAALFMMRSITTLRSFLRNVRSLSEIMSDVNNNLILNNEDHYFVTSWVGVLDLETGILRYVNAGHNPPLIKKRSGEASYIRTRANLVLAAMPDLHFREESIMLDPGDTVFLYTDGVTEAHNSSDEMYMEEGLLFAVNKAPGGAECLCNAVRSGLEAFCGEAEQYDDITVIAVTRSV